MIEIVSCDAEHAVEWGNFLTTIESPEGDMLANPDLWSTNQTRFMLFL
jgi:hypothetical protein